MDGEGRLDRQRLAARGIRPAHVGLVGRGGVEGHGGAVDLLAALVEQREAEAVASRVERRHARRQLRPLADALDELPKRRLALGRGEVLGSCRGRGSGRRGLVVPAATAAGRRPRGQRRSAVRRRDGGAARRLRLRTRRARHAGHNAALMIGYPPMADRAAIVTGASSGIGLALAAHARRGGLRADRRVAPPGEARGRRRGAARRRARRRGHRRQHGRRGGRQGGRRRPPRALRSPRRARQQRGRGHRRADRRDRDQEARHPARRQPALATSSSTASAPTCCAPPAPSTATRWSSTPRRSPARAARAGCRSTRRRSSASSA